MVEKLLLSKIKDENTKDSRKIMDNFDRFTDNELGIND
jgi:hypothetical protein